jgi:FKBP-type peptidyl-prolyl cis-trans isomerase FkpA
MRKLTFGEWVAVVVAVGVVGYFFLLNGTILSLNTDNGSMEQGVDIPTQQYAATPAAAPSTTTMANNSYSLPGIQITDVVVGTGAEAVAGKTVVVNYTGKFTDGKVFDSSIPRGTPFDFVLGAGMVIAGWDEGVAGMKVGGKRTLVIDSTKAYGPNDYGPIPGGSTLIFDVELLDVQD